MNGGSVFGRLWRKLNKTVLSWFFIDQWLILMGPPGYRDLDWNLLRPLLPPTDRYWADPFILQRDDCYYVFIEEKLYATGIGRIACLTVDRDGSLLSQQTVLERPYHLSYPFLFEHGQDLFMIPESGAHRAIELYRCTHFPERWEFVQNLMTDIHAVDATLLEWGGKWWLFANVKAPGGSSLDELHLFYTADLFKGEWRAHPRNPGVRDIASARPAGHVFAHGSSLIRPSQDSSRRYGYALKFNRIAVLSDTDYAEVLETSFTPRGSRYLATHTFNRAGELTVADAVLRRRRK